MPKPCQEACPVGFGMNDHLLVVATSGEVGKGARVFQAKAASHEGGAQGKEVQGQAMTPPLPILLSIANWNYPGVRALVAFFFAGLVVGFCLILRTDFFVIGAGISAISMPKTSASSVSLSALPILGAWFDRGKPLPALAIRSCSSTLRSVNSRCGDSSRRAPMP